MHKAKCKCLSIARNFGHFYFNRRRCVYSRCTLLFYFFFLVFSLWQMPKMVCNRVFVFFSYCFCLKYLKLLSIFFWKHSSISITFRIVCIKFAFISGVISVKSGSGPTHHKVVMCSALIEPQFPMNLFYNFVGLSQFDHLNLEMCSHLNFVDFELSRLNGKHHQKFNKF